MLRPGLVAGAVVLATGCPSNQPGPCDDDVLGCMDGEAFSVDPDCTPDGPLDVVLYDHDASSPVPDDAWPTVHIGSQGGFHIDVDLAVDGVDAAHRRLQIDLEASDCGDEACTDPQVVGARTIYLHDGDLEPASDGLRASGIVLILDYPPGPGVLQVDVLDACGREGQVVLHPTSG